MLITLIIGFYAVYKFIIWNPKTIIKSGINNTYKEISKVFNYIESNKLFNFDVINGVLTVDSTDKKLNNISNYTFDLDLERDKDKYGYYVGMYYDNSKLLDYHYNYDNGAYIKLDNIYDKTIKINDNKYYFNKINYNEIKDVLRNVKDKINGKIPNDSLYQDIEDISINNNNYSLNYVELIITKDNVSKIMGSIISDIKANNSLITSMASSLNISRDEVNNILDNILKELIRAKYDKLHLRVYVNGYSASYVGIDNYLEYNINYNNYNIYINRVDNKYNISINKDNNNLIKLVGNKIDNNIIDIDYEYNNSTGNIYLEIDNNKGNLKFSNVNNKNKYSFNYDFNLNNNYKNYDNNVIDVSELSEEDYINMHNYLSKTFKNTVFYDYIINNYEKLLNY